ncbi:hypothetical protein D3C84_422930 [compost metagenome]
MAGVTCKLAMLVSVTVSSAVALNVVPLALPEAVMVAVPTATPVATPLPLVPVELIVAMAGALLLQLKRASVVTSCTVPSLMVAWATNCCSNPTGTVAVAGVTCKLVTVALVTVNCAVALNGVPLAVPEAVMVVIPTVMPVASPFLSVLLMVAMLVSLLLQLKPAKVVTSWEVPSDRNAVAVNCCSRPAGTEMVAGVTCSAVTCASLTVSSAVALNGVPLAAPEAVMVTVPGVTPVATPLRSTLSIVAIVGALLLQLKPVKVVTSSALPSDKIAVAMNACSSPAATVAVEGVTCSSETCASVTSNCAVAETVLPSAATPEAVMVTVPALIPLARPLRSALSMVAIAASPLLQLKRASAVTSFTVPSLMVASAVNCCSNPTGM